MSRPIPEHGHSNRYAYGCRCDLCTRAATRADAQRRLDRMAGRPRSVPAAPVAKHAQRLIDRGLTAWQIAREAAVEPSTVRRLLDGQETIRRATADRILAVPLSVRPSLGDVPAVGATRRIRALYALGHLNWEIAQEAGISRDAVCALAAGSWPTVKVRSDDGVRAAYDRLSMRTGTSWKTRKLAERNGWAPPLAWDDDTIDDPNAVPQTDALAPAPTQGDNVASRFLMGEAVVLDRAARLEALTHLMEWTNDTVEEIAARLEMSPDAAEQAWNRIKRRAKEQGGKVPWRRVYVPRRALNRDEMESAA